MTMPEKINGSTFIDDRGKMTFNNNCSIEGFKRTYIITGHSGMIRAFHGHRKESKIMQCVRGRMRIVLINMKDENDRHTFYLTDNGDCLKVPAGYYNGLQHLTSESELLVYSDSTTEESKGDDYRLAWDFFGKDIWSMENYR
jgi:dTDP-4-dehydrorhamnose 3,5-epimerase-like enzyme